MVTRTIGFYGTYEAENLSSAIILHKTLLGRNLEGILAGYCKRDCLSGEHPGYSAIIEMAKAKVMDEPLHFFRNGDKEVRFQRLGSSLLDIHLLKDIFTIVGNDEYVRATVASLFQIYENISFKMSEYEIPDLIGVWAESPSTSDTTIILPN